MFRKKKIIWWEQETVVGWADEARQRGASQGALRCQSEPYYGPVTLEPDGADPIDPDALRLKIG